ncbi:MAG: hypothetical protein E7580_02615 [Ruminococcaceae bacterium]|nr:hypothetical protein [Oscillospiraceae bacterium]
MKKRILALVLALAMMVGVIPFVANAVPYSPSANAWKDFGQEHVYIYEVTKGEAAPRMDGYVTDSDGYGKPVATYGFRYCTTAEYVTPELEKRPEFKLRNDGTYYVYPTQDSPQEVWNTIQSMENDSPYGYIWTYRMNATSFSATSTYIYQNPHTLAFATAYHVTADTFKEYTVRSSDNHLVLHNAVTLKEEPADWARNYANYYYKPAGSSYYEPAEAEDGKAPDFSAKTYYSGERIVVKKLFQNAEGTAGAIGSVAELKRSHVILPEEINVYARYNGTYLYYAVELKEMKHKTSAYTDTYYYGTTMSNVPAVFANAYDYSGSISKSNYDGKDATMSLSGTIRTYNSTSTNIKSTAYILRKFGNLEATGIKDVTQVGVDYNITHTPYTPPVKVEEEEEDLLADPGLEEDSSEDLTSGTYGTTVYERRIPWKVLNGKYNPNTSSTAVPEMFTCRQQINLENNVASGAVYFSFTLPRETRYLPGSNARSGANYPEKLYMMRYFHRTGLTTGEAYGTYNWLWAAISSSYGAWEPFVTDYASITTRKTASVSHFPFTYFTAGQEPPEGYAQPSYFGANIRADGAENQKMRIQINVPKTDKEIEEVGAIIAPTEVARRTQLKLGMDSIAYYCEDFPILTGVEEDGTWINMTEDTDKYFATSATPNDSDSYVAMDKYGGKTSGVYTVYTLAANLENAKPNKNAETGEELGTLYSVVFGGPNGEGLYHDFDDFFTFYTIRPYIIYKDGTVVYGEHEYKSIYYLACWLIQDMLSNYNEQVTGTTAVNDQYNMDEMYLASVKDAEGNTLKDPQGNTIYVPTAFTQTGYSPYCGGSERSIYNDEARLQIFRWFAVRLINRSNYSSLRPEYYEDFHPDVKVLVEQYVEMFENIWDVIVLCENTRYIEMR